MLVLINLLESINVFRLWVYDNKLYVSHSMLLSGRDLKCHALQWVRDAQKRVAVPVRLLPPRTRQFNEIFEQPKGFTMNSRSRSSFSLGSGTAFPRLITGFVSANKLLRPNSGNFATRSPSHCLYTF